MNEIIASGIDVSKWQGDFDMAQAKEEGFTFAVIKAGGGDSGLYQDKQFEQNYKKCKALGMPVGAYFFSKALSVEQARKEADTFAGYLAGKQFELPVYMDVEHRAMLDLGKRKLTDIIHAFCQRMEELGFYAGIYSSLSYFRSYMIDEELQRYAHWVACWGKTCNYEGESFGLWQYGGETNLIRSNKVAGQVCDQNYLLIDYTAEIKEAGLNGFLKPGSAPKPAPEDEVMVLRNLPNLKNGDRGDTVKAMQILLKGYGCNLGNWGPKGDGIDGIFGNDTEKAVRDFQTGNGLTATGVCDPDTWGKLLGV